MFGRIAKWRKLDRQRARPSRRRRVLELESLESRTLLSFTPVAQPDTSYLQATTKIPVTAPEFSTITSVADANQTISFSDALQVFTVPNSWQTWASPPQTESATPTVLFEQGTGVTLSFSNGVNTFGVEMEPNLFDVFTMTADFYNGSTLVGEVSMPVNGFADARLFAGATTTDQFTSVVLSVPASAQGFALAQLRYGTCRPGDQFNVNLAASSFTLPPIPPKLALPTIKLDVFNATFTVQAPSSSDQGAICSASGNTDTNGGVPTRGRTIEVGPFPFLTVPIAFATVQVTVTLFKTAPSSVALGAPPPDDSRIGTIFTGAHNVWLNTHNSSDEVLEWYTPGFKTFLLNPLGSPIQIRDTGPLEDWVDIPNASGTAFTSIVNQAEQLIESTNSVIVFRREIIPYLPLLAILDPGQTSLLVTDPSGNQTGVTANGTTLQSIPGSAYFPSVPVVLIAAPSVGTYETQVQGLTSGNYQLITALLNQDQVLAQQSFAGPISPGLVVDYASTLGPSGSSLSTTLVLGRSLDFFQSFINQLEATGGIANQGLANSLGQKLANAERMVSEGDFNGARGILGAFLNEVEAQHGKKINAQAADDLTAYASFLLDFLP